MDGAILAIDTAGPRCSAALATASGDVLAKREPELGRGHAERLMAIVAEVLAEAGLAYRDIGRIVATVGPGSFTGLRVGVAAARGLALTLGVPALGVSTLEALAEPHGGDCPVLALLDAKRGEAYVAAYDRGGAEILAPEAIALDALEARLRGLTPAPTLVVGSGAFLLETMGSLADLPVRDSEGNVRIEAVARLGVMKPPGAAPSPLYLRGADAKPQASRPSLTA
ncbi:tRNA (adenosine(37)-N6)-threonylcarbamoyltransferase complex dimerization subunit type 1 TsaB [Aureimonas endophytica]|uniref:tRNA (Adenosine(37)-N6)-threonylcarbamoyltransferase complex dimerization subunit type 1 TsaB n=1 Tax=Aureimonas endophytica TaxID=2027858 RepID=A0A917ED16_9HYPH|nr:tRNA (adenosine(37)-N6)-threonylcarbamoyltransferase complex dimerization subunit type 1 TsaB [Aureimonas endophytica]GGE21855.1 tRNA (adenosine(37)-N6)-threonylcarbamoyltransferase complex dimerization subunit type 1 TsaB [Aureimonas endophytica]